VGKLSGGRAGYVHIPNMGPWGYSEFHRQYATEADKDALLVDVRFNGGGHVSPLILEKLARKRLGYDANRWGAPEPYPDHSPKGPLVALTIALPVKVLVFVAADGWSLVLGTLAKSVAVRAGGGP